ncbi:hypothetical protein ACLB1G_05100 [Oxalobacteraceae bacterium A2-2]
MNIATFEDLLVAAALQAQPQRLLLAFAQAELEPGGGAGRTTLVPVMCVDKQVGELDTFPRLVEEAQAMGPHWDVVLVSTLSGSGGRLPDARQTEDGLHALVQAIRMGQMERMLAFDRSGDLLRHA